MTEHLLDTGPLVALIDQRDRDHAWSRKLLGGLTVAPVTCEPVLTETLFLLRGDSAAPQKLAALFERGWLTCRPLLPDDAPDVLGLMHTYADVPMSFADACLVRLSEKSLDSVVVTVDSDFAIYRRNRNQPIPTLTPPRLASRR